MRRKLDTRLEALERASGKECTDVIILRWLVGPGEAEQAKREVKAFEPQVLKSSTRQWLREVGESVEQFKRRALSEMEIPRHGMRVLWAEGNQ